MSGWLSFATFSNGEQIENPRFYRKDEADLKRVQKRKDAAKNAQNWDENTKAKGALGEDTRANRQPTCGLCPQAQP